MIKSLLVSAFSIHESHAKREVPIRPIHMTR